MCNGLRCSVTCFFSSQVLEARARLPGQKQAPIMAMVNLTTMSGVIATIVKERPPQMHLIRSLLLLEAWDMKLSYKHNHIQKAMFAQLPKTCRPDEDKER